MRRLSEVIVFTPDLESMRAFYADGVGLRTVQAGPQGARFATARAALAIRPASGQEREIELVFESDDLEADVQRLRSRAVEVSPARAGSPGKQVQLHDPEGNRLSLRQGGSESGPGGPEISRVVINCRDFPAVLAFYRDRMGFHVAEEAPHWIEFETGEARLALHLRPVGLNHPLHAAQRVAYCLQAPDLDTWVDEMRGRGLHFATAPIEEEFGLYAEAIDPDGNVVVFREPSPAPSIEEELAEAFESDEVPHVVAIRKPVLKGAKAVSRVVVRPEYREERVSTPRPAPVRVARAATAEERPASTRGAGPERTRLKPKTTSDSKRARAKPAIGRLRKAEQRSATRQRTAAASAGKSRPIKGAAARTPRK